MKESAPVANYTNELMATRFSDVMWLIEQIMWKSLDKRVASFLLEETSIEGANELKITHETIANHLGSHRKLSLECFDTFKARGLSDSPAAKSQSLIRKDWKLYKDHKTVFLIIHTTCMCSFDQRTVINHCIIEAKSAGKVVCFISISLRIRLAI